MTFKLLSTANPKTQKGVKLGYLTYILHLSPYTVAGVGNACPAATPGCIAACLNTAGRGGMFPVGGTNTVQEARKRKTRLFFANKTEFMQLVAADIKKAIAQAARKNLIPVFRLNGTSDISWEKYAVGGTDKNIFETFPGEQFYDYTKILGRKVKDIANYHLTFSRAENNDADCAKAAAEGLNVATVYDVIPTGIHNADDTDLRFLDGTVGIVGLKAKGRARKDYSGFVIRIKAEQ